MKTQMQNIKICLSYVSFVVLMSGCSSLPFISEDQQPKVETFDTETFNSDITGNETDLQAEIEDFKSMKSSLARLVSLESDLSFLIQEMTRFNDTSPITFDSAGSPDYRNDAPMSKVVFNADSKTEFPAQRVPNNWEAGQELPGNKWRKNGRTTKLGQEASVSNQKFSGQSSSIANVDKNKFSSQSQVEIGVAAPVMQMARSQLSSPTRNLPKKEGLNKFSYDMDPQQIVGNTNPCKEWKVDPVKTYSLHLASYKSRKAAVDGWNTFNQKYADIWCETEAKLAKVVVKGTEYLSLRLGGYDSRDKVLELCSIMKERRLLCRDNFSRRPTLAK